MRSFLSLNALGIVWLLLPGSQAAADGCESLKATSFNSVSDTRKEFLQLPVEDIRARALPSKSMASYHKTNAIQSFKAEFTQAANCYLQYEDGFYRGIAIKILQGDQVLFEDSWSLDQIHDLHFGSFPKIYLDMPAGAYDVFVLIDSFYSRPAVSFLSVKTYDFLQDKLSLGLVLVCAVFIIYNLMSYGNLRNYCVYLSFLTVHNSLTLGWAQAIVSRVFGIDAVNDFDRYHILFSLGNVSATLCVGAMLMFFLTFVEIKKFYPKFYKPFYWSAKLSVVVAALTAIAVYWDPDLGLLFQPFLILVFLLVAVFTVYASFKKDTRAMVFLIALVAIVLGGAISILAHMNLIELNYWTRHASLMGNTFEAVFLSLAISSKLDRRLSNRLHRIEQSQKEIRHSYEQLSKLVYPHQLLATKVGQNIEDTMPTGTQDAVIVCFDIQDSSLIGHSESAAFFDLVLKKCYQEMNRNYCPDTLRARGYMINEMGDGFLCSVGFPFSCEKPQEIEAYELAKEFVKIFRKTARQYLSRNDVYCAVGIASDNITGFFPLFGLKQYTIYGDAIVLATRYEAARKIIIKDHQHDNDIIIVQDKVFQKLPRAIQQEFEIYHLYKQKIRGDHQAEALHFAFPCEKMLNRVV